MKERTQYEVFKYMYTQILKTITNNLPPYLKVNEMVYISSNLSANIYMYTDYNDKYM